MSLDLEPTSMWIWLQLTRTCPTCSIGQLHTNVGNGKAAGIKTLIRPVRVCVYMWLTPLQGLLVYEFMENGSLEDHMFKSAAQHRPDLVWQVRSCVYGNVSYKYCMRRHMCIRHIYCMQGCVCVWHGCVLPSPFWSSNT